MTVAELRQRMSQEEFQDWAEFYKLHPFDDLHRFHRPAALVSVSMAGGEISDRLDWLAPDPRDSQRTVADKSIMKAFSRKD